MNTVYSYMVESPEKVQDNTEALLEALEILAEDIYHANGHAKLMHLRNILM